MANSIIKSRRIMPYLASIAGVNQKAVSIKVGCLVLDIELQGDNLQHT